MPEPLATPQRLDAAATSRDVLCLCTPTPNIPRPRNAFILYHQHHQAQVTIDNPKLSNLDISKIIGEKWKNESDEVKQTWKKLAEEEKQRHQNQYPNYRYQPRRGNKPQAGGSNWAATSPTEENGRCSKCSGRTTVTPQTPSTPYAASQGPPALQRGSTRPCCAARASSCRPPVPFLCPRLSCRRCATWTAASCRRRTPRGGYLVVGGPLAGYKQAADLAPTPTDIFSPGQASAYGRVPLPELGRLSRSQSGPMAPPLRPASSWLDPDGHGRHYSGFDESLRLPPLQTSSPSRGAAMVDARCITLPSANLAVSPPARAVDEAVMTMPLGRHITSMRALLPSAEEQWADGERVVGRAQSTEACTPPDDDGDPARVPVALAMDGFSLTLADRFACAMPIPDAYGVEDHWQWMATLWRGTVCPDLVVYVTPTDADETHEHRTVDLSRRMGLLVFKAPAAQSLDEATERHLAFEVLKWMREASFRHPLPRGWRSDLL